MPLFNKIPALIFILLILGATSACSTPLNKDDLSGFELMGYIKDKKIKEASGIASSIREKDVFWVLNDSGSKPVIFAIDAQGKPLGKVEIKGVKNKDWEDMASFKYKGKPYLMIADVGDNKGKRKDVSLIFIKEPKFKAYINDEITLKPEWVLDFTYEDGPRDCEAVAVDSINQKVILLSKRDKTPQLYELPIHKKPTKQQAVAKRIGKLKHSLKSNMGNIENLKFMTFNGSPTAMDIAPNGMSAVVLTYMNVFYFERDQLDSETGLFDRAPLKIKLPPLSQAEAISFDHTGKKILVTSENLPAPLIKLELDKVLTKQQP